MHLSSTLGACSVQFIPLTYSQSGAAILVPSLLFSSGACSSTSDSDRTFPFSCLATGIVSVLCLLFEVPELMRSSTKQSPRILYI